MSNLPDSAEETESDLKDLICSTVKNEITPGDIVHAKRIGSFGRSNVQAKKGGLSLLVPHRRYLAVFGGIWRYLAVFGGIGRYWAVLGGIGRYWAVLGGIGRYLAVFGICVFYASCQPSGCIRSSVYISITAINDHRRP